MRINQYISAFQSRRLATSQDLAGKFGPSQRIVYRGIQTLEQAVVPIVDEIGIGYFLPSDYRAPPVMFSGHEVNGPRHLNIFR